jgi:hypothetical protein
MLEGISWIDAGEVVVQDLATNALVAENRLQDLDPRVRERAVHVAHRRNAEEDGHVPTGAAKGVEAVAVVQAVADAAAERVVQHVVRPYPGLRQQRCGAQMLILRSGPTTRSRPSVQDGSIYDRPDSPPDPSPSPTTRRRLSFCSAPGR